MMTTHVPRWNNMDDIYLTESFCLSVNIYIDGFKYQLLKFA